MWLGRGADNSYCQRRAPSVSNGTGLEVGVRPRAALVELKLSIAALRWFGGACFAVA